MIKKLVRVLNTSLALFSATALVIMILRLIGQGLNVYPIEDMVYTVYYIISFAIFIKISYDIAGSDYLG